MGKNLLTFQSHEDNSGAVETEKDAFENNTTFSVNIATKQLTLKTTGTEMVDGQKRKANKVTKYQLANGELQKI